MFDDLEQKNTPAEVSLDGENNNAQPQTAPTPAQATPPSSQPNKVEDIFSETEKPNVFKPKQTPTSTVANDISPVEEKSSALKKIIIIIVVIILLALFVWAMFLVFKYVSSSLEEKSNEPPVVENIFFPPKIFVDENEPPVINNNLDIIDQADTIAGDINNLNTQVNVQPIDSDQDGLSDEDEYLLGTDINSVDTDIDGLFDREEVEVYKTNPLDADTDGDGYSDGDEVKGGYNPNGPGKLYEIETSPDISE